MAWFNPDSEISSKLAEISRPSANFISLRRNAYKGEISKLAELAKPFKDKKDIYLTLSNVYPQGEDRDIKGLGNPSLSPVDRNGQIEEKPTSPPPPTPVTDSGAAYPANSANLLISGRNAYGGMGLRDSEGLLISANLLLISKSQDLPFVPDRFPTTCEKCESFQLQQGHPHAGKCLAGHYPRETLWSTDIRWCCKVAAFDAPGSGHGGAASLHG